jgi:hypothetical protein
MNGFTRPGTHLSAGLPPPARRGMRGLSAHVGRRAQGRRRIDVDRLVDTNMKFSDEFLMYWVNSEHKIEIAYHLFES